MMGFYNSLVDGTSVSFKTFSFCKQGDIYICRYAFSQTRFPIKNVLFRLQKNISKEQKL